MNPLKITNHISRTATILAFVTAQAFGQGATDSLRITLDEAIATALKNSYEIQIAKNEVSARTLLNHYGGRWFTGSFCHLSQYRANF